MLCKTLHILKYGCLKKDFEVLENERKKEYSLFVAFQATLICI